MDHRKTTPYGPLKV